MTDDDLWNPDKGYTDDSLAARMRRYHLDRLYGKPPTVRMVDGRVYWIETPNGWVVAKYDCGYFYEPGKDHSTSALAICGPLTPPPNSMTKK